MQTLGLWFELDDDSSAQIVRAAEAISAEIPSPRFTPHVTIFGGLWIDADAAVELIEDIAAHYTASEVELSEIAYDDSWGRSVFVRVSPTDHVLHMHQRVARLLGVSGPIFAPHLSLMYGERTRQEKVDAVERAQPLVPRTVTIDAVSVWHTDPTGVEQWSRIARARLQSSLSTVDWTS